MKTNKKLIISTICKNFVRWKIILMVALDENR